MLLSAVDSTIRRGVDTQGKECFMGKTGFAVTAILATVAIARAGGDPWKTKPFDQWPQQDVQEVLQNSPWAKSNVQAQGAWRPDGITQASGSPSVAGSSRQFARFRRLDPRQADRHGNGGVG
jgi:hypothetical protein